MPGSWRGAGRGPSPLYGPDGFHPSPLGTYLAALVVTGGLTGKPLPPATAFSINRPGFKLTVTAVRARVLRKAAAVDALGGSAVSDARRAALSALIDHAPINLPASLPGPDAIEEYRRARADEHAWMLSRLVWPASRLDELEGEDRAISVLLDARFGGDRGQGGRIALGGGTRRAPRRGVRRAAAR